MAPTASILHADLDSFYASVEQRDDPALRGRPVAVGASPNGGVVLAASYEAKAFGVRTPMNGREAWKLCPHMVSVSPRFEAYTEASRRVFEIFNDVTPNVEGLSVDEAFLDVAGVRRLSGEPIEIGRRLRERVANEVGLAITVGVARTKFLAKVASGVAKPDGLLVVEPDAELEFLHPLPVERLWGVGAVTSRKLRERGIVTVRDVAEVPRAALVGIVGGAAGNQLHALAHNIDPRRVETGRRRRSIGSQQALGRPQLDAGHLDDVLRRTIDRVARRMRAADRVGRTVTVRMRFADFTRATRSHSLPDATAATAPLAATARSLLAEARPLIVERGGLTLLGVSVGNLSDLSAVQLSFAFDRTEADALDAVYDAVRDRFGSNALRRTSGVGVDETMAVPLLPDAPAHR